MERTPYAAEIERKSCTTEMERIPTEIERTTCTCS